MPSTASSSPPPPYSRRPSKSVSAAPDKDPVSLPADGHRPPQHRRDKTNSSSSIHRPRKDSLSSEAKALPPPPPFLKSRTKSAPLMPNGLLLHDPLPSRPNGLRSRDAAPMDSGDDEISRDPFFLRYATVPLDGPDMGLFMKSPRLDRSESFPSPGGSLNHVRQDSNQDHIPWSTSQSGVPWSPTMASLQPFHEINIVVLGSHGIGKSTFVEKAFDLRELPPASFTRRKMSLDGKLYAIRLIELSYDNLQWDDQKCILWPGVVDGEPVPPIDGAFTLYDVTSRESLVQLPDALTGIKNAGIPFLLVACKCDYSPTLRPVDPARVDAPLKSIIGDLRTFQTSESSPDTQKRCLAVLLRQILTKRSQQFNQGPSRRRANSSAVQHAPQVSPVLQKHHRANSEVSMQSYRGNQRKNRPDANASLPSRSKSHQHLARSNPSNTLFELEPSPNESLERDEDEADQDVTIKSPKHLPPEAGQTFKDLTYRLLAPVTSKSDARFTSMFLALYRIFASPSQLLDSIIRTYESLPSDELFQLRVVTVQQRLINVLQEWISQYPGDFAYPSTRAKMQAFVGALASVRLFAAAARELATNLEFVVDDDDTVWACSDHCSAKSAKNGDLTLVTKGMAGIAFTDFNAIQSPVSPITLSPPSASTQSLLSFVEQASKQAAALNPDARYRMTKVQWHLLMDQPEESIAKELTRMDWAMFCSIRPRDLVRHVTLEEQQKAKCRSLENVQRMIDHFNHVALWVANFILLRDKPKHRSFMLEKMMKIARELRKANNYNSLGAFIAGINSSSVQRLAATKGLVNPDVSRDFLKLEILMSSQKSHAAYRLAWANTSGERIPYMPLHRRDLVTAASGNRTFFDDGTQKINWRKFEIMGEVVVGIQKAKEVLYKTFPRSDDVKSLIMDMELETDEDPACGTISGGFEQKEIPMASRLSLCCGIGYKQHLAAIIEQGRLAEEDGCLVAPIRQMQQLMSG